MGVVADQVLERLGILDRDEDRRIAADAQLAMRGFYVGEAAKVAVVVVLFTLVLRTLKV